MGEFDNNYIIFKNFEKNSKHISFSETKFLKEKNKND